MTIEAPTNGESGLIATPPPRAGRRAGTEHDAAAERRAARPLRRMARWVGLSVVAAALLTALATLIAIDSFDRMESALGEVNHVVVPALTSALKLSERAAALAAAAGELTAADTVSDLDRIRARQHGLVASALATLDGLKPALPADRHRDIARAFEDLLRIQGDLGEGVARRIALSGARERLAADLSRTLTRWNDTMDGLIRAARAVADDGDHDVTDTELALGIKADSNLYLASLKATLDQTDENALLDTSLALRDTARSIRDQTDRLSTRAIAVRDPALIAGLRKVTVEAMTLAFGAEGVISLRRAELSTTRSLSAIGEETGTRAIAAQSLVGRAVNLIEIDAADRRRSVAAGIGFSRLQLVVLCLGGLLLAGLVALIISRAVARHENTLHEALIGMESASRSKSEFLANMSHELRTPLNAIIGFAEILKNEVYGPLGAAEYRRYANLIESSGDHLLNIISDILDIAKIEAGRMELHPEPTDATKVLESVTRLIELRADRGKVELVVMVAPNVPMIHTDPVRLKQILLNLASNAVKFTNPGGMVTMSVDVAHRPTAPSSGHSTTEVVRFRVADTGIGMSEDGIRIAMRPFGQIDTPLNRDHDGTGLGLPLVANMVRMSGGDMTIESAVGEGTTVTITLPLPRPDGRIGEPTPRAPASGNARLNVSPSAVGA